MDTNANTKETVADRIARLSLTGMSEARLESLTVAHEIGVDDKTFELLANARRLSRKETIILPRHHLETLSRGSGWARKGTGASAEWGERTEKGYRVGPGRWVVGGNDGFRRKRQDVWSVKRVLVGDAPWTIANPA
jgi:hypothetical protein